jgi:hypothetical protein
VCFARNNTLLPVPKVDSWDDINREITTYCKQYLEHQVWGKESNVGQMLAKERLALTPLPATALECGVVRETKVNSMSLVRFDNNSHSGSLLTVALSKEKKEWYASAPQEPGKPTQQLAWAYKRVRKDTTSDSTLLPA